MTTQAAGLADHADVDSDDLQLVITVQRTCLLTALALSSLTFGSKACPLEFTRCVKKPMGLWLSILLSVFVSPIIAYVLVRAVQLNVYDGIALMVTACCPAGNLSPIFAYYTNSDICLCLAVIVLSNLMSVGMIPLGMFFCASAYTELDLTIIPSRLIMLTMFVCIGCLTMGMGFRAYKEKWADRFVKMFSWTPIAVILLMVTIMGVKVPTSLHASPKEVLTTLLYIVTVLAGTYGAGKLAGRDHDVCSAMALCTASKSVAVSLTILHVSFEGGLLVSTLPVPVIFLVVYIVIGLVLSAVSKAYEYYNFTAFSQLLGNLRPSDLKGVQV